MPRLIHPLRSHLYRVSATDWLEESLPNEASWRSEDTVRLSSILYEHGVDLIDVSTGGNHPLQKIKGGPAYQAPFAKDIMRAIGANEAYPTNVTDTPKSGDGRLPRLLVGTVGAISTGPVAEKVLTEGSADVVFLARQFLRNPGSVWAFADELQETTGNEVQIQLAAQIGWGFKGRAKRAASHRREEDH